MDPKKTIKRLPKAVRQRVERFREDSAILVPTSGHEYFEWYEHVAEIEGYIRCLVDAGIVREAAAQMLEKYCRNEEVQQ